MQPIKKTCATCGKEFWIIPQEQSFLERMGLPHPTSCPGCRAARRLNDRGERRLYRTKCQQCGKDIIVSFDPTKETRKILCQADYREYFEKNSALISE